MKQKNKKNVNKTLIKENKHNNLLYIVVIIMVTIIANYPCLLNGFVNWDDDFLIIGNSDIKGINLKNLISITTTTYISNWHPLTMLSYMIDYTIFGFTPFGFHLTNFVLHILNTVFVFIFIQKLAGNYLISFVTAILFGIHPMHVESVAWLAERKGLLTTSFFLLALIFYLDYMKNLSKKYYIYSLSAFAFALLSKSMAVSFPIVLLLTDYYKGKKIDLKCLKEKIPFFVLAAIFSILTVQIQESTGAIRNYADLDTNIIMASYGLLLYLSKFIYPFNLSAFYLRPDNLGIPLPIMYKLSPFILIIFAVSFILFFRKNRKAIFGVAFFIITIIPVIQIIPVGGALAADRYTYIPYIGFFYIIGELFSGLMNKTLLKSTPAKLKIVFAVIFCIIVLVFSFLTFQRCKVWKNSFTLWDDIYKKFEKSSLGTTELIIPGFTKPQDYTSMKPDESVDKQHSDLGNNNSEEFYFNRGYDYFNKQKYALAIADLNKAIEMDGSKADSYNIRGYSYLLLNEYEKAIADFTKAIGIDPNNPDYYYSRATAYSAFGYPDNAIADADKVLSFTPNDSDAYLIKGDSFYNKREYEKAVENYTNSIKINSQNLQAYVGRARAYYDLRKYSEFKSDIIMLKNKNINIDPTLLKKYENLEKNNQ